ncbi:hypothetical protein EX895_001762 [Sporisorium graminicola]|uniref:Tc1-like transposase DDE domain-containing protein n=1 Tax=Sporisorium graminicola TaxID=280036 RepID=A0A4U7KWW6_9BASI|nr:hypothetical protein EX895_001762 [Sporisorium graminicola]TKY89231.1 hypothetical protein EX895_001762 [Sporisorium graminicola]
MPAQPIIRKKQRNAVADREREQIIRMVIVLGKTKAEVAKVMGRPYSTISTVVQAFLDHGTTTSKKKGGQVVQRSTISEEHIQTNIAYINDRPAATLHEINEHLIQHSGPSVPRSQMSRVLIDRCAITLKRIALEHDRHQCEELIDIRQNWLVDFETNYSWKNAIFFDEAGFNLHTHRSVGRATVGERAIQRNSPADRKKNMSLLVAVSSGGIEASYIALGGWNGDIITIFLKEHVFPRIRGQKRLLVMDNARCHHADHVEQAITAEGHHLKFLPPYTPWFNPTEKVFARIKPAVGRHELRTHNGLDNAITAQLEAIMPEDCKGWLRETKRWARVAQAGHPLNQDRDAAQALERFGLVRDREEAMNMYLDADGEEEEEDGDGDEEGVSLEMLTRRTD